MSNFHFALPIIAIVLVACSANPKDLIPLRDVSRFPEKLQFPARAVAEAIRQSGAEPSDFLVKIEQGNDGQLEFQAWHKAAIAYGPLYRAGNPGGKCRTVFFDPGSNRVTKIYLWK